MVCQCIAWAQRLFSGRVTVRGLEVVFNDILGAGKTASPLLTKKLLGQLEAVGQESCSLPGSLFPPPPVELCPPQGQDLFP